VHQGAVWGLTTTTKTYYRGGGLQPTLSWKVSRGEGETENLKSILKDTFRENRSIGKGGSSHQSPVSSSERGREKGPRRVQKTKMSPKKKIGSGEKKSSTTQGRRKRQANEGAKLQATRGDGENLSERRSELSGKRKHPTQVEKRRWRSSWKSDPLGKRDQTKTGKELA